MLPSACRIALDVANLLYDELAHLKTSASEPFPTSAFCSEPPAILASLLMALLMEP